MKLLHLLPILLALGASACSTVSHCTGEQDYQQAETLPTLQGAGTLKIPQSQAALIVPPEPKNAVPFAEPYVDEDGDEKIRCLDAPPAYVPPPAKS